MTSDEIKEYVHAAREMAIQGNAIATQALPLWEIAYQLAKLNERQSRPPLTDAEIEAAQRQGTLT